MLDLDREKAILETIPLANSIAHDYSYKFKSFIDREDVRQEAYLLLVRAANLYHENKSTTFSTFAHVVITNGLKDLLNSFYRSKRLPEPGISSVEDLDLQLMSNEVPIEQPLLESEIVLLLSGFGESQPVAVKRGVKILLYETLYNEAHPDRKLAPKYAKTNVYRAKKAIKGQKRIVEYFKGSEAA